MQISNNDFNLIVHLHEKCKGTFVYCFHRIALNCIKNALST